MAVSGAGRADSNRPRGTPQFEPVVDLHPRQLIHAQGGSWILPHHQTGF
jgi:hypothetical protein